MMSPLDPAKKSEVISALEFADAEQTNHLGREHPDRRNAGIWRTCFGPRRSGATLPPRFERRRVTFVELRSGLVFKSPVTRLAPIRSVIRCCVCRVQAKPQSLDFIRPNGNGHSLAVEGNRLPGLFHQIRIMNFDDAGGKLEAGRRGAAGEFVEANENIFSVLGLLH